MGDGKKSKVFALDAWIIEVTPLIDPMEHVQCVFFQCQMEAWDDVAKCGIHQQLGTYKAGPLYICVE